MMIGKGMKLTIKFMNRPVRLELSAAARRVLASNEGPLLVEMELYFGCLVRKQVRFHDRADAANFQPVTDGISLAFRPVVMKVCSLDEGVNQPVENINIYRKQAYIPRWLRIHYRNGGWEGTFGY